MTLEFFWIHPPHDIGQETLHTAIVQVLDYVEDASALHGCPLDMTEVNDVGTS